MQSTGNLVHLLLGGVFIITEAFLDVTEHEIPGLYFEQLNASEGLLKGFEDALYLEVV